MDKISFRVAAVLEAATFADGNERTPCNPGERRSSWDEILFRANKVDIENYSVNSGCNTKGEPVFFVSSFW